MAVSFTSGSLALANWGFGAGDLAVLAAAGRHMGNWLMANRKDRSLFEFLGVDVENVILRKGLIDVNELHNRWDIKIDLLKNGRKVRIEHQGKNTAPVVENMDKFTWLMTLIIAALDAALSQKNLYMVATQLMLKMFEEAQSGLEFVEHEAPQHIQGWRSAACVRSISLKARQIWDRLAVERIHWPGWIPGEDCSEVVRLFTWIFAGSGVHFHTTSGDAYSLGLLLNELGLDMLVSDKMIDPCIHEGRIHIILGQCPTLSQQKMASEVRKRQCMMVPLGSMEECVSLWPGEGALTNDLRQSFVDGMKAIRTDGITLVPFYDSQVPYSGGSPFDQETIDFWYGFNCPSFKVIPRLGPDENKLVNKCLAVQTPAAVLGIEQLSDRWPPKYTEHLLLCFESGHSTMTFETLLPGLGEYFAQLQVFVLGYYYALFRPLLDVTELAVNECYGAWRWYDMNLFTLVGRLIQSRHFRRVGPKNSIKLYFLTRHDVLRLAAVLFAGASSEQVDDFKVGTLGVIGKLSLVNSSLLGAATTPRDIGRFHLMDIDATCLPASAGGIVQAAPTRPLTSSFAQSSLRMCFDDAQPYLTEMDFTTHIEPDWERDAQTCFLVYRHRGRVVHRFNPRQIEIMLWRAGLKATVIFPISNIVPGNEDEQIECDPKELKVITVQLQEFHGGHLVQPKLTSVGPEEGQRNLIRGYEQGEEADKGQAQTLLIPTQDCPRAWTCIKAMYEGWHGSETLKFLTFPAAPEAVPTFKHTAIIIRSN